MNDPDARVGERRLASDYMYRNLHKKASLVILGIEVGLLMCELAARAHLWFEQRSWNGC